MNTTHNTSTAEDSSTAKAFSTSWNNLPTGSVYTSEQYADWMAPLEPSDIQGKEVLELGCGNGSLLFHTATWQPSKLTGVDLGDSVLSARSNMQTGNLKNWEILQHDLTTFSSNGYDVVYCIGVLHHLKNPRIGFDSVVRNTKPGGHFHCWVYGKEGNFVVRILVEPIRHIACRLPWWINKYLIATPLVAPYYIYAKALRFLTQGGKNPLSKLLKGLPLFEYSLWISQRGFLFFRHVAFDQLVTPQTTFLSREDLHGWLSSHPSIDFESIYLIPRNGNSWKFGGRTR